jgi:phosphoglycerol transferase MdoB-like AlkP superfamily enzyme
VGKIFTRILYLAVFWFIVFIAGRIIFYLCVTPLLSDISASLIWQSLYKGIRLDISTVAYLLILPSIFSILFLCFKNRFLLRGIDVINYFLILICTLTIVGESCLYREWKSKLSMQALQHFMHPSEVFKTTSYGLTFLFFGLSLFLFLFSILVYNKKIRFSTIQVKNGQMTKRRIPLFLLSIFHLGILFIGMRGGLQAIPIKNSDAYFSNEPIVNDVAVNPYWNIMFRIFDYVKLSKDNPFKDFDQAQADQIVSELFLIEKDTTELFLTTDRPNIVILILEGWSAQVIKSFGGDDFAPFLDSLSHDGICFSEIYPSAYTSDQGIPSILSGYPSVSRISIINQVSKTAKIPCINSDLKKFGYQSAFLFGGDLNYGNLKSYVFNKGFDIVKEEKDFPSYTGKGKLGIHDEYMAKELLSLIQKAREPFLYVWFTLSSHMPYDYKGEKKALVKHKENDYINSITYVDGVLQDFFTAAAKEPWYANTLFVIVADHSHGTHKDFSVYDAEYHRIPLVFFGDVIKPEWKGKKVEKVFSQTDIPATLLHQIGMSEEAKKYVWSKNMFNPYVKPFAYYCSFAGGGMVTGEGAVGFQHGNEKLVSDATGNDKKLSERLWNLGKAFQQSIYEDFRLK